jgi:secreted PhoX family phosphatase
VQHPGEIDGASAETPASQWPDGPEGALPRPSVVNVTKEGFGSIGC